MIIKSEPAERSYMLSVTIPLKVQNLPVNHKRPMTEFKINYRTRRDGKGKESVCKVNLPSIPTEPASARRACMPYLQPPLQSRDRLGDHRRRMTEFKIDYHTQRDHKGKESVHKVYLPSTHKGWAIMVEKDNVTGSEVEELPPATSIMAEKPKRIHRKPLAEHSLDRQAPTDKKRSWHTWANAERSAKFKAVNGVVLPSVLEPGQSPVRNPWATKKDHASRSAQARNKRCPICGDCFPRNRKLQRHFIHCVRRNGNPQGYYWNGALNDERRIGKEIAELHCRSGWRKDEDTEGSTEDRRSGGDYRTMSYEPSESSGHSRTSRSPSSALTPDLGHDRIHDTEASPQSWNETDHGYRNSVTENCDDDIADENLHHPNTNTEEQDETYSRIEKSQASEQPRDTRAHTLPLNHNVSARGRVWNISETTAQRESKADSVVASGHDDIHGDFDAVHITTKAAVPVKAIQRHDLTGNSYSLPTPLTANDFSAGGSLGRSSSDSGRTLASPANITNKEVFRPLLPSSLSRDKKRQIPSDLSPPAQGPKRPRMLPSEAAKLPQVITPIESGPRSEERGLQLFPASVEASNLNLSSNGSESSEKKNDHDAVVRHYKAAGLRINTQAAESAVPLQTRNEATRGEKLYADYIKTHEAFRKELDHLTHELCVANKRADEAELRANEAQNEAYRANSAGFERMKELTDKHRAEMQKKEREYRSLDTKCQALEQSVKGKDEEMLELKWELQREREMSAKMRKEQARTVQKMNPFGPSL